MPDLICTYQHPVYGVPVRRFGPGCTVDWSAPLRPQLAPNASISKRIDATCQKMGAAAKKLRADLAEAYRSSPTAETIKALAKKRKCKVERIKQLLREGGVTLPKKPIGTASAEQRSAKSAALRNAIKKLALKPGVVREDIADELGVSVRTVQQHLSEMGMLLRVPRRSVNPKKVVDYAKIMRLTSQGKSWREIAAAVDCSEATVRRVQKRYGGGK